MKDPNEFGKNIHELLGLLKKILKSQKAGGQDLSGILEKKNVNLNLCFFTFLPVTEDELDDFETDMLDYMDDDALCAEELCFELNPGDQDFLKQNGIAFE